MPNSYIILKHKIDITSSVQSTTVIVETVLVETTVLVEQKTLTTQFYLLLVESPLYTQPEF